MRDRILSRHNLQDFITNRLVYHRLREQPPTKDYLTVRTMASYDKKINDNILKLILNKCRNKSIIKF